MQGKQGVWRVNETMRFPLRVIALAALCLGATVAGAAGANGMTGFNFYEVVQDGVDVKLTMRFMDRSIEAGYAFSLERLWIDEDADDEHLVERVLFSDKVFTKEEAGGVSEYGCHTVPSMSSTSYCEQFPDECSDCDDDGTNDCSGHCGVAYYYEVHDDCVPKGEHDYLLTIQAESLHTDSRSWEVEKDPGDCGCACSAGGMARASAWLPLLVLLAIGACALLVSKR